MSQATELDLQQLISMQQQARDLAVRRKYIRSTLSGAHLSRLRGRGMEFDEVRVYQAGDEVSSIDWKVTARKGVTHTKIFREERERPVLMCVDYRASMFFATQGVLKSVLATQAAALLAWHGVAQGDRLGGLLFSDDEHHEVKPARGRNGVLKWLHACTHAKAWERQNIRQTASTAASIHSNALQEATARLRRVSKPGSLIYIFSDFRGLNDGVVSNLGQLARHNDVVLLSVSDGIEESFPNQGAYPVFDGEKYRMCYANDTLQQHLQQLFEQRMTTLSTLQKQHGIQHIRLNTSDDVVEKIRAQVWQK